MSRLQNRFAELKAENRAALVTFITAGDPDYATSLSILKGLPDAGADVIELGMPFTDPMADGPAIQLANIRALAGKQGMQQTLQMVREFRAGNQSTPLVLMGYYNPILSYGVERFCLDAGASGVDGLIIVDLPPGMTPSALNEAANYLSATMAGQTLSAELQRNGESVHSAIELSLSDCLATALWLARKRASLGQPLRAGDVLLTGAQAPMLELARGDRLSFRIGGLGEVTCAFI